MTGDYTPDLMAILSADIIISTPEKWDGISRNWHSRTYVKKVQSFHLHISFFFQGIILLSLIGFLVNIFIFFVHLNSTRSSEVMS
jgi:hypothetical protein